MDIAKELGVQSFCFRGFKSHAEVIAKVKECDLSKIELCRVHIDFGNEAIHDEVIEQYRKGGVQIVSTGVNGLGNHPEAEEKMFQFAHKAGCKFMSVDFGVDSYRTAERLADKYDINLAIHNHGGRHWLGCAAMLRSVFKKTSSRIGLCIDTAWALHSHEDPLKWVEEFAPRVYGVHFKDFTFERDGRHNDVVVGTGCLDLKGLLAKLKAVNFNGYAVLEYEADVNNPVPALSQCVKSVREAARNV